MELKPFERVMRCAKCAKYTDPEYLDASYCEGDVGEKLTRLREERDRKEEAEKKLAEGVASIPFDHVMAMNNNAWSIEKLERCQDVSIEHLHVSCNCGFSWLMHTADHPEHGLADPNWEDADDVVG